MSDVIDPAAALVCREMAAASGQDIRYFEFAEEGGGASASRNRGAAATRSPLIAFLDDDDLWDPTYLSVATAHLGASGRDLVVTWMSTLDDDGERPGLSMPPDLPARAVGAMNPGATGSNVIISREAFTTISGYDGALIVKNDTDLLYRLLLSGHSYAVVQQRLVKQRRHDSGQLTSKLEARAAGTQRYIDKHRATLSRKDVRVLRASAHHIRSHSAARPWERVYHLLCSGMLNPGVSDRDWGSVKRRVLQR